MFDRKHFKMNDNDLSKLETFNKYNKNIEFICDDAKNIIDKYKIMKEFLCLYILHIY